MTRPCESHLISHYKNATDQRLDGSKIGQVKGYSDCNGKLQAKYLLFVLLTLN